MTAYRCWCHTFMSINLHITL